jgi:hypothetical protein
MAQLRRAVGHDVMDEALRAIQEQQLRASMEASGKVARRRAEAIENVIVGEP